MEGLPSMGEPLVYVHREGEPTLNVAQPAAAGTPVVRWSRIGDIGLCVLFSFVALAPIVRTYQALADGLPILALHHALSGTATLIMAALLVLRREALFRTTRRREQV